MKAVPPVDNEQSTATEDALRRVVDIMPTLIHTERPDGHPDYFKRGYWGPISHSEPEWI